MASQSFLYTGDANFGSGWIVVNDMGTGAITTQVLVVGMNTVSTLENGHDYLIYTVSLDAAGRWGGSTLPIEVSVPGSATANELTVLWRVDETGDWSERDWPGDTVRCSNRVNLSGYSFQHRVKWIARGKRTKISNTGMEIRHLDAGLNAESPL